MNSCMRSSSTTANISSASASTRGVSVRRLVTIVDGDSCTSQVCRSTVGGPAPGASAVDACRSVLSAGGSASAPVHDALDALTANGSCITTLRIGSVWLPRRCRLSCRANRASPFAACKQHDPCHLDGLRRTCPQASAFPKACRRFPHRCSGRHLRQRRPQPGGGRGRSVAQATHAPETAKGCEVPVQRRYVLVRQDGQDGVRGPSRRTARALTAP